ncbi:16S rRNA (uracil(1498)-N(3))-methyltransferase [Porphyrobacter sp. AAP82]|uniref:16S rRNA (uracil(1498)-N(3))-methyltransferase n=1 Tax=Porphyrobacter sp. AAP82 TaxID=1248917 RepID=UPI0003198BD5|nr:16S rRNA (uracil(1498)-N(3))-methyltransferase [Porphyrobacter sp. AAP82]
MPATPAWPPKSAPRLFVAETLAAGAAVRIEGNAAHYLARVMRVAAGDAVILCDDMTGEWAARVTDVGKRDVMLEVAAMLRPREAVPDLWLCPALLKKDRFDFVLEKATELGAGLIQPLVTRRCVADKLNLERARAITTEAAEQCARTALPQLAEPVKLDALLADWPESRALFFADENGGEPAAEAFRDSKGAPAAILTGPEGGFDDAERAGIRALPQSRSITLGPRILRGETAAIAALALWMGTAGDW